MSHLLIVTVPASMNVTTMAAVRDYVAGSLPTGVLVLEDCMTWEVTDLPELGGTVVQGNQPDESGDCPGEDPPIDIKGRHLIFQVQGPARSGESMISCDSIEQIMDWAV